MTLTHTINIDTMTTSKGTKDQAKVSKAKAKAAAKDEQKLKKVAQQTATKSQSKGKQFLPPSRHPKPRQNGHTLTDCHTIKCYRSLNLSALTTQTERKLPT